MHRERAINFVTSNYHTKFYQPIIFLPGILEIQGKWHERTKQLANSILKDVQNKSVIDLGCCTGFFLQEAKQRGASKCLGVDHDIISIERGKEITEIMELDIEYVCQNVTNYEHNQKFDVCLLLNVLHVIEDKKKMIDKTLNFAKKVIIECDEELETLIKRYSNDVEKSVRSRNRILISI